MSDTKRRVLIISANYHPEMTGVAPMATELSEDLVKYGYEVTVLTSFPSYPERVVKEPYKGKFFLKEKFGKVNVIRTWMMVHPNPSPFWRVVSFASFIFTSLMGSYSCGTADAIICLSSPMPVGFSAYLISRLKRCDYIYNAQDLLLEASVQMKYLKPGFFLNFGLAFEGVILKNAKHITVICNSFKESMLSKEIPEHRIKVIPNWIDIDFVKPTDRQTSFRKESGFKEEFIFMHAGNVGLIAGHEYVIEAARKTRAISDLKFVYLGSGLMKPKLEALVKEKGLSNVAFYPIRPREEMPVFLPAADCHLVALDQGQNFSLPSKLATIMAAGRPVIGVMDEDTDAAGIIRESGCGLIVPPRNPERLAEAVLQLYKDPELRATLGKQGRKYAEAHFNRSRNTEIYDQMLSKMIPA